MRESPEEMLAKQVWRSWLVQQNVTSFMPEITISACPASTAGYAVISTSYLSDPLLLSPWILPYCVLSLRFRLSPFDVVLLDAALGRPLPADVTNLQEERKTLLQICEALAGIVCPSSPDPKMLHLLKSLPEEKITVTKDRILVGGYLVFESQNALPDFTLHEHPLLQYSHSVLPFLVTRICQSRLPARALLLLHRICGIVTDLERETLRLGRVPRGAVVLERRRILRIVASLQRIKRCPCYVPFAPIEKTSASKLDEHNPTSLDEGSDLDPNRWVEDYLQLLIQRAKTDPLTSEVKVFRESAMHRFLVSASDLHPVIRAGKVSLPLLIKSLKGTHRPLEVVRLIRLIDCVLGVERLPELYTGEEDERKEVKYSVARKEYLLKVVRVLAKSDIGNKRVRDIENMLDRKMQLIPSGSMGREFLCLRLLEQKNDAEYYIVDHPFVKRLSPEAVAVLARRLQYRHYRVTDVAILSALFGVGSGLVGKLHNKGPLAEFLRRQLLMTCKALMRGAKNDGT